MDFNLSDCHPDAEWIAKSKKFNITKMEGKDENKKFLEEIETLNLANANYQKNKSTESNKVSQCSNIGCYSEGKLRCSACKKAKYCSAQCQRENWSRHKLDCK